VQEQRSLMQVIKQRQANWIGHVLKTWLSSEDCTKGENGREMAKRKTKKEDVGPIYGARGQEDQLRGAKERSGTPGRMASSSVEPALKRSTKERHESH